LGTKLIRDLVSAAEEEEKATAAAFSTPMLRPDSAGEPTGWARKGRRSWAWGGDRSSSTARKRST
jgi:hypothetical protein